MTKKFPPKKLRQKVVLDGQFSQNRPFKFSPVDFRYNRMSGKKFKNFGVNFFLGCWMQKSVREYLALLQNSMGAKGGVT